MDSLKGSLGTGFFLTMTFPDLMTTSDPSLEGVERFEGGLDFLDFVDSISLFGLVNDVVG